MLREGYNPITEIIKALIPVQAEIGQTLMDQDFERTNGRDRAKLQAALTLLNQAVSVLEG